MSGKMPPSRVATFPALGLTWGKNASRPNCVMTWSSVPGARLMPCVMSLRRACAP